jgi:type IV secretion system protein VirD4
MYFGFTGRNGDDGAGPVVGYEGDAHILTVGPTRSGKSRRLLIPNLLYKANHSMVVVDVKGELAEITAPHRAAKGSRVVALDPFGTLAARKIRIPVAGFNPMAALNPASDDFVDDAMGIAEALVQVKQNDQNAYFTESAQDLVAALIMLVKEVDGPTAALPTVRTLLCKTAKELEQIVETATNNRNHPAILAKLAKFKDVPSDSRELPAILTTAQTQTRFLDSPGIARSLRGGGFDWQGVKERPETIYLVLPPSRLTTHAKWLRLVISSAMSAMQKTLARKDRPPVLFMLDEFPQLGRLAPIEAAVSLNAGFGVKVWAAVQNLGQLKELYKDNWETFLSAGAVTVFQPRDYFTRDHMTNIVGEGSRRNPSVSVDHQGHVSRTEGVIKDKMISTQEWQGMAMGEHIVIYPNHDGQTAIQRIFAPDYTRLPEVRSGALRPAA